jgi:micrococcal nuclease
MGDTEVQEYREAAKRRRARGNTYKPSVIVTYQYWAHVDRVVDGDTAIMTVSLGFDASITKRIRLFGVNAPELRARQRSGGVTGAAARDFLAGLIPKDGWVEVRIFSDSPSDKYGRWLGELFVDGGCLNEELLKQGYASLAI